MKPIGKKKCVFFQSRIKNMQLFQVTELAGLSTVSPGEASNEVMKLPWGRSVLGKWKWRYGLRV